MAWTPQGSNGLLHTGTNKDVFVFMTRMGGSGQIDVQIMDPAKPVGVGIYASPLGDTRWEAIFDGGTGGNVDIRRWTLGTPAGAVTSEPHLLTAGEPYILSVRWIAGKISVFLNGAATAITEYDTNNDLAEFTGICLFSETDGAAVGLASLYTLVRTFALQSDVAWWVAGGTLYASDSGRGGGRAIGTFFDPAARIRSAEGKQHAYIIDGAKIVDFDAVLMTAEALMLDAGTMPGQSALNTPPGATDATAIAWNNDRLILVSQNAVYLSAIGFGTPTKSFDIAEDSLGKAVIIPAKTGQPLISIYALENNRLVFTSERAAWSYSGDPALGAEMSQMSGSAGSIGIGATGPHSAVTVENGLLFMHTNAGMYKIPSGGGLLPLSRDVLTDIVQQDMAATTLTVSMCVDTKRHGVWTFLTPSDESSSGRSLFYDIRVGAYSSESGGWFPIDFADPDIQPTCCMNYQGDVVFGTRSGKMMFMDSGAQDDAGTPFTSTLTMNMLRDQDMSRGVLLRTFELAMGIGSEDTALTILGGETPERAFLDGFTVWTGTMNKTRNSFTVMGSAGALVLKMSATGRFAFEACQTDSQPTVLLPMQRRPAPTPASPCQPPAPTPTAPPDDTGGGPGPGDPGGGPGTCTECADWMAENATTTINGDSAYRLAGPNTLQGAQAEVSGALPSLLAENLCDIGDDPMVWVSNITDPDDLWTDQAMLSSAFLALTNADIPDSLEFGEPNGKGWMVLFICEIQP